MELTFLYDVVCPYAWMASTQVEALALRTGATLAWKPVLLGGIFKNIGGPTVPATTWSEAKVRIGERDLYRQAERLGLPLTRPQAHPRRTVNAMRLCVAASDELRPAISSALYRAYWVEGLDVADPAVLAPIARAHGLDPELVSDPGVKERLVENTAFAADRGAFGVPTFLVGDQLWWGADRMHLVEQALGGRASLARPTPDGVSRKLTFYHDFSSPFSYLASTRIARLAAEHGAVLEWRPVLVGALFRDIGTPDVPLLAMAAPKQRWYRQDMEDQARWLGVPFRFPSVFPVRSVLANRVALAEPAATPHLYRALWAEDRDISQRAVVESVLREAGLDAEAALAAAETDAVKARLRANTADAVAAGAAGVPTFVVDGEILIWGVDRLDHVEAALAGWRPARG